MKSQDTLDDAMEAMAAVFGLRTPAEARYNRYAKSRNRKAKPEKKKKRKAQKQARRKNRK